MCNFKIFRGRTPNPRLQGEGRGGRRGERRKMRV